MSTGIVCDLQLRRLVASSDPVTQGPRRGPSSHQESWEPREPLTQQIDAAVDAASTGEDTNSDAADLGRRLLDADDSQW